MSVFEKLLTEEALKALVNYGVLGIIAVIFLSPIAWLLWVAARGIKAHGEGLATQFRETCSSVLDAQPKLVNGLENITRTNRELAELIASADGKTKKVLDSLSPHPDHMFSSTRIEECLLHLCGLMDALVSKELDSEVRANVLMYSGKMRKVLEHKINNAR